MKYAIRLIIGLAFLFWTQLASAATWREAETRHFIIASPGSEKDLLKFAQRLEWFHSLLGLATGADESQRRSVKVRVYLVDDIGDVKRYYGDTTSDVAGYYSPRLEGAIAVVPRKTGSGTFTGQLVLFHEYAHHYMLQYTPAAYPSWYVEGFAELASTASFERSGSIVYGRAASHRQYELQLGGRYSPADMVTGKYLSDASKGRGWSYGDAWLLTHYLTFSNERRGQLRAYLNAINSGMPISDAAKVFGDPDTLNRNVGAYVNGGSFPARLVPIPKDADGDTKIRVMTPGEVALIDYQIEIERIANLDDAAEIIDDPATKEDEKAEAAAKLEQATQERTAWLQKLAGVAAQFADDPAVWRLLAEARCMAKDYKGCQEAAEHALSLAPADARATVFRSEAILAMAPDLPAAERKTITTDAVNTIVAAVSSHPDDPVALFAYYSSFGSIGRSAPPEAIDALILVVQTVPQVPGPRLTLAHALISRGRLADARVILRPLAYSPHQSGAAAQARAMLDDLDQRLGES
ncbi:MAG: hypothetical protein IE933_03810 [Sphingomonadales bacterium]|nr:hypothetical protein [Sphingomonadales bacterium]MBD3774811.1 hypothetical protein [Paracoccaceae bacterium]